ncbi:MAG: NAD(P)H-dependent oxidoreductase [Candidatus Methylomirabilota bacterium]
MAAPAPTRALLLVGSPKPKASTSASLGAYLFERLGERDMETQTLNLRQALRSEERRRELLAAADAADLLVLAFPLYEGNAPAIAVEAMELIAAQRRARPEPRRQAFVALENHGLPEPEQAATALAICQRFAHEARIEWAGALSLPMGPVLRERPLGEIGRMVRNVTKALDLAALALASGETVPDAATRLMLKPLVPRFLFGFVAERDFRKQAEANGVLDRYGERPYAGATAGKVGTLAS